MGSSVILCVFCALSFLSRVLCDNQTTSTNSTSMSPNDAVLPNRSTREWEKRALFNITIAAMVILVIVGGIFFIRYMRTEKKNTLRRYARLSKADDDDDIELSVYEKK